MSYLPGTAYTRPTDELDLAAPFPVAPAVDWRDGPDVVEPLARSDDNDRPSPVVDDVRGDAAKQEAADETAGVAADNDHVRALRVRSFDHGGPGVTFPDQVLSRDAVLSRVLDDPGDGRLALGSGTRSTRGVKQTARQLKPGWINYAQEG